VRALAFILLVACTRPGAERALGDLEIGAAALGGSDISVLEGMAAVRKFTDRHVELWASAPLIEATLFVDPTMTGEWTIIANNVTADAQLELVESHALIARDPGGQRRTVATFRVQLQGGSNTLRIGSELVMPRQAYRIAALADIQNAMPQLHEVFGAISSIPDLEFVVGMGDITDRAEIAEYDLYEEKLVSLNIPFYTTIGNHELWADPERWFTRFGRMNFQFNFGGVFFTFIDSGDAGVDPIVEEWLDGWLDRAAAAPNIFLTHMPPIDPVAHRYGGFRSMRDGHRLLSRLVEGNVDLTLYGHIHTYIGYENAGIEAHVSGGGGADPMKLDGIDRHFLILDVDAARAKPIEVSVHRVD
jgi:Icc-related predicted phosphoesterase